MKQTGDRLFCHNSLVPGAADDLAARLAALPAPVRLVFFTRTFGCDTCLAARGAIDQIVSLSDRITVEEHNLVLDKDKAVTFGIDKAPAIAIVGDEDPGIRYYGVPAGHESGALIETIELVACGETSLSAESIAALDGLERSVHIQVFVTPT